MINELINDMVDAGVHYGHQTKKWNPRMKPFLMKDKGGIYIIDLEKTVQQLDKASDFLADLSAASARPRMPSAKPRKPPVNITSTTAGWAACSPTA